MITVYSTPNCMQCKMTVRELNRRGLEHQVIDLTTDSQAYDYVTQQLGYQAAPVVTTGSGDHWTGFRPDKVAEQAAVAAVAG